MRKDRTGGKQGPVTRSTIGALLSYEHQGRDKLRRTGLLKQSSTLYSVAADYWLLKLRL